MLRARFEHDPSNGEFQENKRNGYGYWAAIPQPSAPLDEALPEVGYHHDFTEVPHIIDLLVENRSVLVKGAPGSGKSHLLRDVASAAVMNNLPTFYLYMHINGGKRDGIKNISDALDDFRDRTRYTGGGLVILDNLDYIGYRGHRGRSRSAATEHAQDTEELVTDLLGDKNLAVLATAHDNAWREGKWTWDDPAINKPAWRIIEAFNEQLVFEGKMALMGLTHILRERNLDRCGHESQIPTGRAAHVIRLLRASGRANFFHANHLDIDLFLEDPNAAIAAIEQEREIRRGKA